MIRADKAATTIKIVIFHSAILVERVLDDMFIIVSIMTVPYSTEDHHNISCLSIADKPAYHHHNNISVPNRLK